MAAGLWKLDLDGEIALAVGPHDAGPERLVAARDLDALIVAGADAIRSALEETTGPVPAGHRVLAPIGAQPVWASGVTYERSRAARNAESATPDVYDLVYVAERPELFLKAAPGTTQGPGQPVGIRSDSTWDVPEPELTLALDAQGRIAAFCCGNDMSSRSIEGENPLYLPQAKVYDLSCALGPCLVPVGGPGSGDRTADRIAGLEIGLRIERDGAVAFEDTVSSSTLHRDVAELADWLFRAMTFPVGAFLMTGTGIVPPEDFTLAAGDVVSVDISGVGTLTNPVTEVESMSDGVFAPAREDLYRVRSQADGPTGLLPLTDDLLRNGASGTIFGLTQNVGMGADPARSNDPGVLILSTQGGMRHPDGTPAALGYHTGHYELGTIAAEVAGELTRQGFLPFAGFVSDPCDGRSQGTTAMFDSLPYRNDASIVMRRLIRSLPHRVGVVGIATCDKGLPAMMMALAGSPGVPSVLIPGGVTLPAAHGEDAGTVQTLGARYAHGMISLEDAASLGCMACASPGGGCQFLGTAATAQVVGEALGLAVGHTALAPSGEPVWLEGGLRAVAALQSAVARGQSTSDVLSEGSIRNAMVVHAAFGGSTNLLLHIPAIAHAAGLPRPVSADWLDVARSTPRIVSVLPNGPVQHPTVRVYLAGGVPEVMLHLRGLGLLDTGVRVVEGTTLGERLDAWEGSERRQRFRAVLAERGFDPDEVIFSPDRAAAAGMRGTVAFPTGNLAPHGSVVKATAIDPKLLDEQGVYELTGPARVFTAEDEAIAAIKDGTVRAGEVVALIGCGPAGTGMEETYQLTSALKQVPFGRQVALVTDARFSGVSTGACIGHVGPEALAGGPIGRLRTGDLVRVRVDANRLSGSLDFLGSAGAELTAEEGAIELARREPHPELRPHPELPPDTRLWAALQDASGGTWGGCVYDVDAILERLAR